MFCLAAPTATAPAPVASGVQVGAGASGGTDAVEPQWRSSLFPENWKAPTAAHFADDLFVQDFSRAGYRSQGLLLPRLEGPVFPVVIPQGQDEKADCTALIQAALDKACAAGGGVVLLPEGTLRVSVPEGQQAALVIRGSKVVLRGAGQGRTHILNTSADMRNREVIRVAPDKGGGGGETVIGMLIKDVTGPVKELALEGKAEPRVGEWVEIRADLTDEWILEHGEPGWLGKGKPKGSFCYLRQVEAWGKASGVLTVDIPMRLELRVRDRVRVCRAGEMLEEVGLEGFSVASLPIVKAGWRETDWNVPGTAGYAADRSQLIRLFRARNSWVADVSSYHPAEVVANIHQHSNGIELDHCARVTLSKLNFARAQYGGANGNGYMYRLHNSQDCLVADSVSDTCRHGFVFSGFEASGNVLLRCKDLRSGRQMESGLEPPRRTAGWGSDHHMWLSHSNLIDQCEVEESAFVAMYRPHSNHFLTASHTVFWNTAGVRPLNGHAVISQQVGTGYVIGTRGAEAKVSTISSSGKGVAQTEPIDLVEGEFKGAGLVPQSLYVEQVRLRALREHGAGK